MELNVVMKTVMNPKLTIAKDRWELKIPTTVTPPVSIARLVNFATSICKSSHTPNMLTRRGHFYLNRQSQLLTITTYIGKNIAPDSYVEDFILHPVSARKVRKTKAQKEFWDKATLDTFMPNIGKKCHKTSSSVDAQPNPFKSGKKIATIKDVVVHPVLWIPAYQFEQDDSFVACYNVIVLEEKNEE